jgi:CRISPR/Cas system CSM-associated protein Csm2 small subunit
MRDAKENGNCMHNLICSHYQGRPIGSLRTVLQLIIRENSDHVHLENFRALRDFFNSAAYHHHFLKYM